MIKMRRRHRLILPSLRWPHWPTAFVPAQGSVIGTVDVQAQKPQKHSV